MLPGILLLASQIDNFQPAGNKRVSIREILCENIVCYVQSNNIFIDI